MVRLGNFGYKKVSDMFELKDHIFLYDLTYTELRIMPN